MVISEGVFIVTGGTSGLGWAAAQRLSQCGGHVVIADVRNIETGALNGQQQFVRTDITDQEAVSQLVQFVEKEYGKLNGVINCAGIPLAERVLGKTGPHSMEDFARVIHVNLIGTFNVIRLAGELIAQSPVQSDGERGVIVNTASIAAFDGQIGQAAYAASKGGIAAMTLPLARELGQKGIRVVAVAPGIFSTPMMETVSDRVRHTLENQTVFPKRMGNPKEFAELVRHIIENTMINGEVIRLDGAIRLG